MKEYCRRQEEYEMCFDGVFVFLLKVDTGKMASIQYDLRGLRSDGYIRVSLEKYLLPIMLSLMKIAANIFSRRPHVPDRRPHQYCLGGQ